MTRMLPCIVFSLMTVGVGRLVCLAGRPAGPQLWFGSDFVAKIEARQAVSEKLSADVEAKWTVRWSTVCNSVATMLCPPNSKNSMESCLQQSL